MFDNFLVSLNSKFVTNDLHNLFYSLIHFSENHTESEPRICKQRNEYGLITHCHKK